MACGMIAMLNAGIEVESYDAYEIDKYAIKVSSHNFPNIKHHGDVFQADFTQYEGVDFLVGGSPCTYWSIAQKNNRETEASGMGWELFSQYVRAVKEAKPKFFIYENNKSMSAAIRASIDNAFGFDAVCINSALVSAQNRQRLYWVGQRNADGTYSKVPVEQPKDLGIFLKDVLDNAVAWQDKAFAYTTRCQSAIIEDTLEKHRHTMCAEPVNLDKIFGLKSNDTCIQYDLSGKNYGSQDPRAYYPHSKHGTLNASSTESKTGVIEPVQRAERGKPIYEVKDGQISIKGKKYPIKLSDGYYIIRKLTVIECMRLQTVPEWYDFSVISNSQAYKCLGNGWTCEVITHLINATQKVARRKWLDGLLGDCL
jgi:DNA (cytosine-5)-methyltransferase 3A